MMRYRRTAAGFTLTEIMIALAMTALLLIGISKIFAITSATISTGQAAAKAMRSQRAIQQAMSGDLLGTGVDVGNSTYSSGMLPLVNTVDVDYASPFLSISGFRVAAYKNAAEMAASPFAPADQTTALNAAQFASRSLAIRGVDANKDGVQDATSIFAGGETIPLYVYGERNFRCDTLGFFSHGRFASQTSSDGGFQSGLSSNESFVWYGHLRVFNSTGSRLDITNAYGSPGDLFTPNSTAFAASPPTGVLPNRNNRFADQFRLGRVQSLLAPAIIGNGRTYSDGQNSTENDNAINATGVFVGNDTSRPVRFVQRNWRAPDYIGTTIRPSMTPFDLSSSVQCWVSGTSQLVYSDDRLSGATPAHNASAPGLNASTGRSDVIGVDIKTARKRINFVENRDLLVPLTTPFQSYWWENVPASWSGRYWVNPFPRTSQFGDLSTSNTNQNERQTFNSKSLAQRQQLLADSASQFIVEFAGDFVTQDPLTGAPVIPPLPFGGTTAAVPDGVLDFVVVNVGGVAVKQTRWYGMPRDVNGDGVIPGYDPGNVSAANITSPDVIPVSDFASDAASVRRGGTGVTPSKPVARSYSLPVDTDDSYAAKLGPSTVYTFEKSLPPLPSTTNNFASAIAEPSAATDPSATSYTCVWGPREFTNGTTITAADGASRTVYAVPQLIRVLTDIRDPDGRMKEAMTQEYVFPVRVTGAVKPPVSQ